MCRIGPAIDGAESPAVATWYSSGVKRWWLVRSTTVTSARALRKACAAHRPPKPQPTMTTRGVDMGADDTSCYEVHRACVHRPLGCRVDRAASTLTREEYP